MFSPAVLCEGLECSDVPIWPFAHLWLLAGLSWVIHVECSLPGARYSSPRAVFFPFTKLPASCKLLMSASSSLLSLKNYRQSLHVSHSPSWPEVLCEVSFYLLPFWRSNLGCQACTVGWQSHLTSSILCHLWFSWKLLYSLKLSGPSLLSRTVSCMREFSRSS